MMDRPDAPARGRPSAWRRRSELPGLWFVAPALVLFALFNFYPMLRALYLSLTEYNLVSEPTFVGPANYLALLGDDRFLKAFGNTLVYMVGTTLPLWALALGVALGLHRQRRFQGALQAMYFLPVVLSGVSVAVAWKILFHPNGLVNTLIGPFTDEPIRWLSSATWAPVAMILLTVWQELGFYVVIFMAGLQQIPREFYDAGRIDGAGGFGLLRNITLPLLRPAMVLVMVVSLVHAFQAFTYQFILTRGGPSDATNVLSLYIYSSAFSYLRMGAAAAMSIVMMVVIVMLTLTQMRLVRDEDTSFD
jgi:ABC-type sugar transport system permease subunit